MKIAHLLALILVSSGCALQSTAPPGPLITTEVEVIGLLGQPRPVQALRLELAAPDGRTWTCTASGPSPLRCPALPAGRYRPLTLRVSLPEGEYRLPLAGPVLDTTALHRSQLVMKVRLGYRRPLSHRITWQPIAAK